MYLIDMSGCYRGKHTQIAKISQGITHSLPNYLGKQALIAQIKASPYCPYYQAKRTQITQIDGLGKQAQIIHITWESKVTLHRPERPSHIAQIFPGAQA